MSRLGKTIYQTARMGAGYTQEKAAELLNISVRSIRAYEGGETIPHDDVVVDMASVYNVPYLAYQHLKINNEIGKRYLPEIKVSNLSSSILDLRVELEDTSKNEYSISSIGRDNRVDKHEQRVWNECMDKVKSLIAASFSILLAPMAPMTNLANKKCYLDCNQDSGLRKF
ncbi:helix-turn-helix domain-containing protein [Anaerosinus massiliensis]|uniref:helix-turn-helix domain-containing protein n=1 Tax=Massilibacillus massiliensis TaxID=1806837 RepID=UPI000DA61FAA|nr:helix-turn-helix transcriptional regulator [Massilibacillus massiliensis]